MTVKVSLSKTICGGASASVEYGEETMVVHSQKQDTFGRCSCLKAAKKLREAADRFERLAEEEDAFLVKTQEKVNRRKA